MNNKFHPLLPMTSAVNNRVMFLCCHYCEYKTRFTGNLAKHVRTHTGERPFQCHYCSKRFASKSNFNTHTATHAGHDGILNCPVQHCQFTSDRPTDLHRHIQTDHQGEEPGGGGVGGPEAGEGYYSLVDGGLYASDHSTVDLPIHSTQSTSRSHISSSRSSPRAPTNHVSSMSSCLSPIGSFVTDPANPNTSSSPAYPPDDRGAGKTRHHHRTENNSQLNFEQGNQCTVDLVDQSEESINNEGGSPRIGHTSSRLVEVDMREILECDRREYENRAEDVKPSSNDLYLYMQQQQQMHNGLTSQSAVHGYNNKMLKLSPGRQYSPYQSLDNVAQLADYTQRADYTRVRRAGRPRRHRLSLDLEHSSVCYDSASRGGGVWVGIEGGGELSQRPGVIGGRQMGRPRLHNRYDPQSQVDMTGACTSDSGGGEGVMRGEGVGGLNESMEDMNGDVRYKVCRMDRIKSRRSPPCMQIDDSKMDLINSSFDERYSRRGERPASQGHIEMANDDRTDRYNDDNIIMTEGADVKREKEADGDQESVGIEGVGVGGSNRNVLLDRLVKEFKLFRCAACNILYTDYALYVLHLGCHGIKSLYQCNFCLLIFRDKFEFNAHFVRCPRDRRHTQTPPLQEPVQSYSNEQQLPASPSNSSLQPLTVSSCNSSSLQQLPLSPSNSSSLQQLPVNPSNSTSLQQLPVSRSNSASLQHPVSPSNSTSLQQCPVSPSNLMSLQHPVSPANSTSLQQLPVCPSNSISLQQLPVCSSNSTSLQLPVNPSNSTVLQHPVSPCKSTSLQQLPVSPSNSTSLQQLPVSPSIAPSLQQLPVSPANSTSNSTSLQFL